VARRAAQRALAACLAASLVGAAVPPVALAQSGAGRDAVTLNFVNAEIDAVSRAMAAILNRPILVDPRVRGSMTLYSEQALSPRAAYEQYLSALRGLGFAAVESGGTLKIVPEADAKLQTGTVSVGPVSRRGDQILTQIFRLQHENANNLVAVLRPLISPNNTINANPGNNTLVITDYADNLRRISRIIAAMDMPASTDVDVIALRHAVAADLLPMLQRLLDQPAGTPGAVAGASGTSVMADPRTNSLLVKAPNNARLNIVRSLVERLDQPGAGGAGGSNIYVVYLKNAEATKLATLLRASFAAADGPSGGGTAAPAAAGNPIAINAQAAAAGGASPQSTAPVQSSSAPVTGGFVQADPATNSLVITAPEPLYRQLRAVIDQLDARRAQVYIESMIVEVSGGDAADFGFQWQGLLGESGDKYGLFAGTNFSTGGSSNIVTLSAAAATGNATGLSLSEGLNIGLVRNYGGTYALAAIARALQSKTKTNVVSTPNMITLDNEEAKIVVGENVPFITGQFTNTGTATTNPFQTIERKDVGITLRIRPQIGEGGTVRMTIFQEQSSVKDTTAAGTSNAGPSTTKRSIESQVVVEDGQIIVLGGLIEDRFIENKAKVPILGDIPVLGALFRSESREKQRTNLMVFLRPVVMRDAASAQVLSLDRYDLIRARQQAAQPAANPLLPIEPVAPLPAQPALSGALPGEVDPAFTSLPAAPAAAEPASAPAR
jgi:general secretion pathway protein D